jgi:hypothetical protein
MPSKQLCVGIGVSDVFITFCSKCVRAFYVPGTPVGTGNITGNKIKKFPHSDWVCR